MTRRKLAIVGGIAILTAVVIAGVVHSERASASWMSGHHHHHGMTGIDTVGAPLPMLLKSANLSDAQKAQVKEIFHSNFANMKTQFDAIHTAQQQIAAKLWASGTVNPSDLSAEVQAINQARDQLAQAQIDTVVSVRNQLSAEQLASVAQAEQKFEARRATCAARHHKGATAQESPQNGNTPAPA